MNYTDINKIYTHMKTEIYPHVHSPWKNVSTETCVIDKYLSAIGDNRTYKLLAIPYLIKPNNFLKKHKDRCVIFYNTPDPKDGMMLTVHQITPTLHIHSRYFCWVEKDIVLDQLSCLIFTRESSDGINFINDTFELALTGNTDDVNQVGFNRR